MFRFFRRPPLARFGPYRFDRARRTLARGGRPVPLSALPTRILAMLIEAPGRVTTRADLKAALWPRCERIDTERRLNTGVRALREALGEDAERPRYIETVRGTGYRWIGRAPWRGATLAAAAGAAALACVVVALAVLRPASEPPLTAREHAAYVLIAVGADRSPGEALPRLEAFLRTRPLYRPALELRAGLAARAWRQSPSAEGLRHAEAALDGARARLGDAPELDLIGAELALRGRWNASEAEHLLRRVLARDPGSIAARRGLAWLYLDTGRPQRALAEAERALSSGDLSADMRADLGWLMLRLKREDLALDLCATGRENANLIACRQTALERRGDWTGARLAALELITLMGADAATVNTIRSDAPREGYARFLAWRARRSAATPMGWFQRAQLEASGGDLDAAMMSLHRAYAQHDPDLIKLSTTAEFAPLIRDTRFVALKAEISASIRS